MPDFSLESRLRGVIAGIDEAGRGPWAGPVVAAAAVLDRETLPPRLLAELDDSKRLSAARREELFLVLEQCPTIGIGVGIAEVADIDRLNILEATMAAMARAVEALGRPIDHALVDGNRAPRLPCPVTTVVRGDGRSLSIAAASIVAKVTRDRVMTELASAYPGYGFETNMGYGTAQHQAALDRLGVTPHHRRSFAPIASRLREPQLPLSAHH
ncbi:MAG: ribonuclease HII [Alphaproteobacteria bacterium]